MRRKPPKFRVVLWSPAFHSEFHFPALDRLGAGAPATPGAVAVVARSRCPAADEPASSSTAFGTAAQLFPPVEAVYAVFADGNCHPAFLVDRGEHLLEGMLDRTVALVNLDSSIPAAPFSGIPAMCIAGLARLCRILPSMTVCTLQLAEK